MARKFLVNCLHVLGVTGLSQVTSNHLTASGTSQELYEFATADTARFYLDISAISGSGATVTFDLYERDPATGLFVKVSPTGDPLFGVAFTATRAGLVTALDPVYGECYQVGWTVAGTGPSVTCSLLAQLTVRG